jgi:ubiquinone/menaquinone biosynthesis C-methylase UbiE
MQPEDYNYLYELEDHFWWFSGMRTIAGAILDQYCEANCDRRVLDAGCGTGSNLLWLQRYAGAGKIYGIDISFQALQMSRQRGPDRLVQASVTELPFDDSSFDLVTSFDVLVQLPTPGADVQAIREMYRVLRPGGIGFVRAAAFEWLRSGHDKALGTQKRYRLSELSSRLESNGLVVLRATYANSLLLPAIAFRRLVLKRAGLVDSGSDVKPLPPWLEPLNMIMRRILQIEAAWLETMPLNLPAGVSAICVVRKPDQALHEK